jgi:hypothetical protein
MLREAIEELGRWEMRAWGAVVVAIAAVALSGCATTATETSPAAEATPTEETTTPTETESAPAPSPPAASSTTPEKEAEEVETPPPAEEEPEAEKGEACGGEVEGPGSDCHAEDEKFCSENSCIPNFPNGNGAVVECVDGEYSHSGGLSGACSDHGGEKE